uniref:Long neurotoxin LNTX-2 n=1 Tax=Demansia vestigiata TaxID=412038 RepID=3L22_DEMVE|nr:RecName: Full=Long neurotoxin LNTX-2; Flags: Precursor [Demansia vestigiata]ABK63545.1 LNTX-2 precursor [Demansia vestigiata]
MKTLLLTLVVVTIVCLDFGYARTCLKTPEVKSEPCPPGQEVCYTKAWRDRMCSFRGKVIELGCAATCPRQEPGKEITCCSTDDCNTHP